MLQVLADVGAELHAYQGMPPASALDWSCLCNALASLWRLVLYNLPRDGSALSCCACAFLAQACASFPSVQATAWACCLQNDIHAMRVAAAALCQLALQQPQRVVLLSAEQRQAIVRTVIMKCAVVPTCAAPHLVYAQAVASPQPLPVMLAAVLLAKAGGDGALRWKLACAVASTLAKVIGGTAHTQRRLLTLALCSQNQACLAPYSIVLRVMPQLLPFHIVEHALLAMVQPGNKVHQRHHHHTHRASPPSSFVYQAAVEAAQCAVQAHATSAQRSAFCAATQVLRPAVAARQSLTLCVCVPELFEGADRIAVARAGGPPSCFAQAAAREQCGCLGVSRACFAWLCPVKFQLHSRFTHTSENLSASLT